MPGVWLRVDLHRRLSRQGHRYAPTVPLIRPVILSGGSGTRLWPISTSDSPKQFAPLFRSGSLFRQTMERLHDVDGVGDPVVVTGADHLSAVTEAAADAGVAPSLVIVEPRGRNTAPAVVAAALSLPAEEVMVILPSDHLIRETSGFVDAVQTSAPHAIAGSIVTFGIEPARPETGYGYIEKGDPVDGAFRVRSFTEKPDIAEAERLVTGGQHLWNSGMFVVTAGFLIEQARLHCPEVLEGVESSMTEAVDGRLALGAHFGEVESISLDHAVMEKTRSALVMPIDVGWDDVGSFHALWSVSTPDSQGNVAEGDVILVDVGSSFIKATSRKVAVAGMDDVVVVETPEAVLVVPRSKSQLVREVVRRLADD